MDARQAFDDYHDRVPDAAPPDAAPIVSTLPDITGDFYGAAAPPVNNRFIYFRIQFTYTPVTTNTGTLDFSGQPLDFMTMAPVGDPFVDTAVPVDSTGSAHIHMDGILPAAANSIAGIDVVAHAIVNVTMVNNDFACGSLTGTAGPLDLAGTTFAAQRITGDTLPTPIYACQ